MNPADGPLAVESGVSVYCCDWRALAGAVGQCDALIVDAPYSARTHAGHDDASDLARERYAAKGETLDSLGYSSPAFFQATIGGAGDPWPIARVVEWSRTLRGGRVEDRRIELFAGTGINDGCMRWGLCETPADE